MKHAYLIMAHNEFELLHVLISMLDDARNDIYLHVDKKAKDFAPSDFSTKHAHLFILDKRLDVRWGHFSQIKLEMLLFETAAKKGPYAYYHLLSGVDLPIKSQDYIHDFFAKHQGKEFVGFWHDNDWQAIERVNKYHLFMKFERIPNRWISILMAKARMVLKKVLPSRPIEITFKKGPNWVSITHDFCQYLLSKKKWILRRFKYTQNGDEVFLQSVIWNSSFRDHLFNESDVDCGCMRLIDWERGSNTSPYTWQEADLPTLLQSDKLFARKFKTTNSAKLISKIQSI